MSRRETARSAGGQGAHRRAKGPPRRLAWLALAVAILLAGTAVAHRLDVTVEVVGGKLGGRVAYHGGRPVAGATVEVRGTGGAGVATTLTDGQGRFEVELPGGEGVEVIVITADGHAARTRLAAPPPPRGEPAAPGGVGAEGDVAQRVARQVGEEMGRQLAPIRESLAALERRTAVRDVLGGLGYLLGLAGVAAYLLARRAGSRPDAPR